MFAGGVVFVDVEVVGAERISLGGVYNRNIVSRSIPVDSVNYIHDNRVQWKLVEPPRDWE